MTEIDTDDLEEFVEDTQARARSIDALATRVAVVLNKDRERSRGVVEQLRTNWSVIAALAGAIWWLSEQNTKQTEAIRDQGTEISRVAAGLESLRNRAEDRTGRLIQTETQLADIYRSLERIERRVDQVETWARERSRSLPASRRFTAPTTGGQ